MVFFAARSPRPARGRLVSRDVGWWSVGGLWIFAVLSVFAPRAAAQQRPGADSLAAADTLALPPNPPHSPRGAFIRSLLIPGWGHAWVGAPETGGIYFALESGSLWMLLKSRQKLRQAEERQAWLRDTGELSPNEELALVQSRERQVEDWTAVSIGLLFFSAAHAFVDAHLEDFGERVGNRVGVAPGPDGGVQLQATLPVGGRR